MRPNPASLPDLRDVNAVMETLRAKGKPNTADIYKRHGARSETLGVSYADLDLLTKKIKVDHDLAIALWETGVHDAMILATKIIDPAKLTKKQIDGWVASAKDHVITGAIAGVAARTPLAAAVAKDWVKAKTEHKSSAGWAIYAQMATDGHLDVETARGLIATIAGGIHAAANRTRYSMNSALIAIGGGMAPLRVAALAAAKKIGKVEVDHGETGCKTPDATSYIEQTAARHRERAQ